MAESPAAALFDGAADGRLRWAVNIQDWQPAGDAEGEEFQFLLTLIREAADRERVLKFRTLDDKKRALLSRLLCRRACTAVLGLDSFTDLEIARTKGKKPFLKRPRPASSDLANFNFNVSHEGDWVVLASEPLCVCGVDVAAPPSSRARPLDMSKEELPQLTKEEWAAVRRAGRLDPASVPKELRGYDMFQRHWSAKEAFVKARGDGLAFELGRAAFQFEESLQGGADCFVGAVCVDGKAAPRWRFFQSKFGTDHWITVARGPTGDIQDADGAFTATLQRPSGRFAPEAWEAALDADSPAFSILPVGALVPSCRMEDYVASGGAWWPPAAEPGEEASGPGEAEEEPAAQEQVEEEEKEKEQESTSGTEQAVWRVVGGGDKGGIIVRGDRPLTSPQLDERLATGSLVKELELVGERLNFERLEGAGPASGWVSISLKGVPLLTKA